ncbi:hypothetical protein C6P46_006598 [Rhodotorula mucilaginosa]|uniref:Protein YOP1 n=1 Tax=Rhodotorula mucilaginosa TaxID=5537 RepID=A0A9P6VYD6_RHOMI|nr:hypothetical protein C6P46_006598 [Rhodotorula mucilaginosa]TKA56241.1 hypothetical protein B0A53_01531 [Rhodotorula sp. CCFEE 5036]
MFYYLCKVISTAASLLYPIYASYKALRPAASVDRTPADQAAHLERWLMFWCVMGCVALWEQWAEWGVSWFPFYHEVKTLVVLWLVLPQIQGATYIYINHLSPFLTSHEGEIDAAMTNARASATKMGMDYLNRGLRQARAFLLGNLFVEPSADGTTSTGTETPAPDRPPVLAEPALMSGQQTTSAAAVSGLARFAGGLLRQYAPAAIAAGNVLLQPMNKTAASPSSSAAAAATTSAHAGPASAGQDSETRRRAARSRRQELEAELASLHDPDDAPLSSSASETESSSTTTKAGAGGGGGGVGSLSFVEIVEAEAREYAASRQAGGARKSGSWFGWSSSSGGGGVDSAKKDA